MRYQLASVVVAGGLYLALCAQNAMAQADAAFDPSTFSHDAQMFAPAEMDLDGLIIGQENRAGAFFAWDKVYFSTSGELVTVGDKNISRELMPVWVDRFRGINPITNLPLYEAIPGFSFDAIGRPLNPDTGLPINRPIYVNSIRETGPNASFRSADRYEFGYNYEDHGWLIGIMDGPDQQFGQFYGLNGGMQEGQGELQSPLGDVFIQFEYEQGLMHGYVDLVDGALGTGRVLPADTDGDGILDGDGFADDIDGDGQYGPDGVDVVAPFGVPETYVGLASNLIGNPIAISYNWHDPDDLVELPTSFRTVLVRNAATTNGIELMAMHRFNNRHWMAKHKNNNNIEFYYGVRYLRFRDNFVVNGNGGVLGLSMWDTQIINNVVGPQVALNWTQTRGRWSAKMNGRFTFGYNVSNWDQNGFIGEDLTPGRLNHPLYLQPFSFKHGRKDDDFSPIAEMRMEVAYNVTRSVALKAGWTGMYVGNIYRASTHIKYRLPTMGFLVGDQDNVIVHGATGGIEFNY